MIKHIRFINFRNLNNDYSFNNTLNIVFGNNNSGKTNLLDGIRLAFSSFTNDYVKIKKSDFGNSDDSKPFYIYVELEENAIPSLNFLDSDGNSRCGFKVVVNKTSTGRYTRKSTLLNGCNFDIEIARDDEKMPNICTIPLIRSEDLYSEGLITGLSNFIDSEEKYKEIRKESKNKIKEEMSSKIEKFKSFCNKFNQTLDIDFTDPRLIDEKAFVVDGDKEHNLIIGSGYKSIANIILNTLKDRFNIILVDELENHLHPALIRTLIRELRDLKNVLLICTTHSPVIINEAKIEELIDVSGKALLNIDPNVTLKLNTFLHTGRAEILFADNVVLVEGYTEELLLKDYLTKKNHNWTIVNVAGVMFVPYIELA